MLHVFHMFLICLTSNNLLKNYLTSSRNPSKHLPNMLQKPAQKSSQNAQKETQPNFNKPKHTLKNLKSTMNQTFKTLNKVPKSPKMSQNELGQGNEPTHELKTSSDCLALN